MGEGEGRLTTVDWVPPSVVARILVAALRSSMTVSRTPESSTSRGRTDRDLSLLEVPISYCEPSEPDVDGSGVLPKCAEDVADCPPSLQCRGATRGRRWLEGALVKLILRFNARKSMRAYIHSQRGFDNVL